MSSDRADPYSHEFFKFNQESGLRSAAVVIPLLLKLLFPFRPQSVVDVGCGTGAWLATCLNHGISDILGVDGDYVDESLMLIPASNFLASDLTQPLTLDRRFDLALSLEVGEHLPPESSETLVDSLVRLSSLVLFSAAIPHQGGTGHLNEQWPGYWVGRFRAQGYAVADILRSRLWNNDDVFYWYAQNILLFVKRGRLSDYRAITETAPEDVLPLIHPRNYLDKIGELKARDPRNMGLRTILSIMPAVITKAIKRRLARGEQ